MRPILGSATLRAAAFVMGLSIFELPLARQAAAADAAPAEQVPPAYVNTAQVQPSQVPTSQVPTSQVPTSQVPGTPQLDPNYLTGFAPAGPADAPLTFDTNLGLIERATIQAVEEALQGVTIDPGADILLHPLTTNEGQWFVEDCIARVLSQKGYKIHLTGPDEQAGAGAGEAGGGKADSTSSLGQLVKGGQTPAEPDSMEAPGGGKMPITMAERRRRAQASQAAQAAQSKPPPNGTLIPLPDNAGLVLTFRIVEFGVTYHDSWRRGFMGPRLVERLASVDLYTRLVRGTAQNVLWAGRGRAERLDIVPQSKLDLLEGRTYPFTAPSLKSRPLSRLAEPVLVSGIITGLVFLFYSSQH